MEDPLQSEYWNVNASYMDQLYELFDYVQPKKKKKYKYIVTYKSTPDPELEGERIRFNMYMYDTYHGRDGWHYNLLTGRLEKK